MLSKHAFVKHGLGASLKPLISALAIAGAFGPALAQAEGSTISWNPGYLQNAMGHEGAAISWEPGTYMNATGHIMTNIPAPFAGGNVNNIIGANTFYNAGINGQNSISANVEAGHIWNGHETLGHVAMFSNNPTTWDTDGNPATPEFDRHGTWVGQHLGGRNGGLNQGAWQPGIAPGTDLRSGAVANAWVGGAYALGFNFNNAQLLTPYRQYFGTADVINSSWGGTDPEGNGFIAVSLDGLANQNPSTTFTVSAGNSGPGSNTVGTPGSGYNAITVGALQNDGANNYDTVAGFSSRGPQSYADPINGTILGVRAAVDIAAPGTNLTAAYYGGQTGGNNPTLPGSPNGPAGAPNFYTFSVGGTSFAAPITAGGAALVNSASRNDAGLVGNANSRDARVVKAVLLNSADKIPGWNNGQIAHPNGFGGVQTTQSLDWASGAGALNLDQTYHQYINAGTRDVAGLGGGNVLETGWDFGEVAIGGTNVYTITNQLQGGSTLNVTLDWFRERALDISDTAFDLAQADLDLIIRDTVTNNIISDSISMYNVVEHLSFLLPMTSMYAIEVAYVGNVFDFIGLDAEQYGLAWWGEAAEQPVPEPEILLLMLIGAAGVLRGSTRRRIRLAV